MNQEQALKIIETTKNTYELIGDEFSNTRNRIWPEMKMLVKKYVGVGDKVLDIGCGNGRLVKVLPEVNYLGIDGSEMLLNESKVKSQKSKVKSQKLDMLELDKLGDEKFNVIFMFASFNHIPSEELRLKILDDIKNLLKPNGLLIMTNWNMWQVGVKKNIWNYKIKNRKLKTESQKLGFKDIITTWQNGNGDKQGELYYRAFTKGELKKIFKKSGFNILENYYSMNNKKVCWLKGKNIVTVVRLDK